MRLEKEEVDRAKCFERSKIVELLINKKDDNWTKWGYEKQILQIIAKTKLKRGMKSGRMK